MTQRFQHKTLSGFIKRLGLAGLAALMGLISGCGDHGDKQQNGQHPSMPHGADHAAHETDGQHHSRAQAETSSTEASASVGGLELYNPYIREPVPGQSVAAGFIILKNTSDQAYTINHVTSPVADNVEVHRTVYQDGMMSMRHVHHLVIAPQSELVFEPGGYHLMLKQLNQKLEPGDEVPLRVEFDNGVTLDVTAEVRPLG